MKNEQKVKKKEIKKHIYEMALFFLTPKSFSRFFCHLVFVEENEMLLVSIENTDNGAKTSNNNYKSLHNITESTF